MIGLIPNKYVVVLMSGVIELLTQNNYPSLAWAGVSFFSGVGWLSWRLMGACKSYPLISPYGVSEFLFASFVLPDPLTWCQNSCLGSAREQLSFCMFKIKRRYVRNFSISCLWQYLFLQFCVLFVDEVYFFIQFYIFLMNETSLWQIQWESVPLCTIERKESTRNLDVLQDDLLV